MLYRTLNSPITALVLKWLGLLPPLAPKVYKAYVRDRLESLIYSLPLFSPPSPLYSMVSIRSFLLFSVLSATAVSALPIISKRSDSNSVKIFNSYINAHPVPISDTVPLYPPRDTGDADTVPTFPPRDENTVPTYPPREAKKNTVPLWPPRDVSSELSEDTVPTYPPREAKEATVPMWPPRRRQDDDSSSSSTSSTPASTVTGETVPFGSAFKKTQQDWVPWGNPRGLEYREPKEDDVPWGSPRDLAHREPKEDFVPFYPPRRRQDDSGSSVSSAPASTESGDTVPFNTPRGQGYKVDPFLSSRDAPFTNPRGLGYKVDPFLSSRSEDSTDTVPFNPPRGLGYKVDPSVLSRRQDSTDDSDASSSGSTSAAAASSPSQTQQDSVPFGVRGLGYKVNPF
jgi:hypothetical protein